MASPCFLTALVVTFLRQAGNMAQYSRALAQHRVMEALKEPKDSPAFRAVFREAADLFVAARNPRGGGLEVLQEAAKCCKYAGAPKVAARLFDIFAQCSHAAGTAAGTDAAVRNPKSLTKTILLLKPYP
eukprot:1276302-Pyramimonas_sp.AAC.1